MANTKKKKNVKITSVKKNNNVLKNGVKTTIKKPDQVKKNEEVSNDTLKERVVTPQKAVTTKKPKTTVQRKGRKNPPKKKIVKPVEPKEIKPVEQTSDTVEIKTPTLTQDEAIAKRKERNRKKYEKGQQKYRDNKEKKKIIVEDAVEEETKEELKEEVKETVSVTEEFVEKEEIIKKAIIPEDTKSKEKEEQQQRKEKRNTNRKTTGFTQTLSNLKEVSVNKINDVREKVDDNTIPLGKTFDELSKRSKRLVKEAIVYAIILTIINVLLITFLDYFNFLRLFDVKALNVVITIIISLIFNFFVAFMVDYFVTNVWLKKKRKTGDGEQNGDNRSYKEKRRKNIEFKEGE